MALRAGYYGLKRSLKDKLFNLAASTPADIGPDNPIASKGDVLTSIDLLDDTVGWIGGNYNQTKYANIVSNGVTFTVNSDGTITASGDNDNVSGSFVRVTGYFTVPNDITLILSGGVNENCAVYLYDYTTSTKVSGDVGSGSESVSLVAGHEYGINVWVKKGTLLPNPIIFKPMLLTPEQYALNPPYRPYHESVEEMMTPKLLPTGADLNNYLNEGEYFAGAGTYSNCPISATAFRFKVMLFNAEASRCIQIIYANKTDPDVYMRTNFGGTWQSWYKFTGTEVTPPSPTPENETKKSTKKKVIKEEE